MSDFVDIAYSTFSSGLSSDLVKTLLENVVLPKSVYQNGLGLRVTSDVTTNVNPIKRTVRFAFGPSGATTATATVSPQGVIESISMTARGGDYVAPPQVTLGTAKPIATPAILRAFLRVKNITFTAGAGYAAAPSVAFLGGLPTAGRNFRGCVRSIYIIDGGLGYTSGTTITIDGGGPAGPGDPPTIQAKATVTVDSFGRITSATLTDMGAGYTQVPKIGFHTGGTQPKRAAKIGVNMAQGTPARAHATVMAGAITAITLDDPGEGYISVPDMVLTGGTPTAPGTAAAHMEIDRVDVLFGGGGYLPVTTVAFTPYFKTLYPDGSNQGAPFTGIFKAAFTVQATMPVIDLPPVLT